MKITLKNGDVAKAHRTRKAAQAEAAGRNANGENVEVMRTHFDAFRTRTTVWFVQPKT